MKTVKLKEMQENVKVGDMVILNTYSDPKLFMCKKNVWNVVSVSPFRYREYGRRTLCEIDSSSSDALITIVDKKEYKRLPFKAKTKYYTTAHIDEAKEIVRDKILDIFRNMPWKEANLISYLIRPDSTALGAAWSYNEDTIENLIYQNIFKREGLEYDGNAGCTLISLAKHIKEGLYDEQ